MIIHSIFKFVDNKIIITLKDRVCETSEELLASELFHEIVKRFVNDLKKKDSPLLQLFNKPVADIQDSDIQMLIEVFQLLSKMTLDVAPKLIANSEHFSNNPSLLYLFVERLYDYWRTFERFIVCDSTGDRLDKRPYRTFNRTVESLTDLIRKIYRDIQENITGLHPNIYRQVPAGAEVATIALPRNLSLPSGPYQKLQNIPVIRQILIYPPLLLNPPMNKRTGKFRRIDQNPLELMDLKEGEWLCYPAKVGALLIAVYFHEKFFELGFTLCNLFELAEDKFLKKPVDAVYVFGAPSASLDEIAPLPTVFYEDSEYDLLVGAIPDRKEFGYFGYLKKMILTLHNIKMMKLGRMPYHGAMVRIILRNDKALTILIIGDTGAGKSETLEAFRTIGEEQIKEIIIIADDMGSLDIDEQGHVIGYGSEVGAFVRLDDLQLGYAFGQLDRTIIMNPSQVNARVVLPVTTYENVIKGYPVDMVLYANNYEDIDEDHPIIERLTNVDLALRVFREGAAMSKGTTTTTGLVHTYFVNVFGAVQYKTLHDNIAKRYFETFFAQNIFVGQLRTRLGIASWERKGPEEAANELLQNVVKVSR